MEKVRSTLTPSTPEPLSHPVTPHPWRRRSRLAAAVLALGFTVTACGTLGSGGDQDDGAPAPAAPGDTGDPDATTGGDGDANGAGAQDDAFTVGVITPLTGVASLEGNALRDGFELGVQKLNDNGGVFGRDVEVVYIDDQGDAAVSTQSAQKLITQDNVDYLFGTIAGDTSEAVAGVAAAEEVPFSTAMIGSIPHCSPHFWPFGATERMVTQDVVPYMMEQYGDTVGLVGNDYLFPRQYHEISRELIEDAGGTVAVEEYSSLGTSDWQPVINRLSGANTDWIFTAVVGGDAISFTQQADQFGLLNNTGISGVSLQQEFYPGLTELIEGTVTALPYSDQLPGADNEEFVAAFREAYDFTDPIPVVAATSYHAVQYIGAAVEAAGSTDAAAISEQMPLVDIGGLMGASSFNPDNHTFSTHMHLLEIQPEGIYAPIDDFGVVEDPMTKDCS